MPVVKFIILWGFRLYLISAAINANIVLIGVVLGKNYKMPVDWLIMVAINQLCSADLFSVK